MRPLIAPVGAAPDNPDQSSDTTLNEPPELTQAAPDNPDKGSNATFIEPPKLNQTEARQAVEFAHKALGEARGDAV